MTLFTNTGAKIVSNTGGPLRNRNTAFVDAFSRADSASLGNGWIDGHDWDNTAYEPLGIYNKAAVVSDPTARVGADYAEDQFEAHPPLDGKQHQGIGCAWRDMGTESVYLEVEWSGLMSINEGHHVEGAPIVHVVPGSPEHGLGIWPSALNDSTPLFFIAGIGNPPEDFGNYIYAVAGYSHTDGMPRKLGIQTNGTTATFWLDGPPGVGTQISLSGFGGSPAYGLNPFPVPANLQNSTLHGFELDTHYVSPPYAQWTDIPATPVVNSIVIKPN